MILAFSGSAYAGLAACNGATYNLGTGANGLLPGGAASGGCQQLDKQFSGFGYSSVGNFVPGSTVPVTFGGTTFAGPIFVQMGASQTPVWDVNTNGQNTQANASYNIAVDPASSPGTGESYAIIKMTFNEQYTITAGNSVIGNDGLTLFEYFCAGGQTACVGGSAATGGINMTAATAGFIEFTLTGNSNSSQTFNFACFNNGNTNSSTDCATQSNALSGSQVNFALTNYNLGFQNVYVFSTLSVTSGGDDISLNYLKDNYYQILDVPEPGAFGLIGASLAGLALLRLRRRK